MVRRASIVAGLILSVCGLGGASAQAATESFGPALPVPIHEGYALNGHSSPESNFEWFSYGAFEQEGRPRAAPISGTLSQFRLEYGSVFGMEVQIWIAEGATGALVKRVDTLQLAPTGACGGGEKTTKVETLTPNTAINAGQVLVLLNSDDKGGYICASPEGIFDGYFGGFGENFEPEIGKAPSKWSLQNGLSIALEGTVTNEPSGGNGGGGGGNGGGGSSSGGSSSGSSGGGGASGTGPQSLAALCGRATDGCLVSVTGVEYLVTVNPGGKTVYTRKPGAYELPVNCSVRGQPSCEIESGTYCSCSVPFGTISRAKAPKQTLVGRGKLKLQNGQAGKVKISLSRQAQTILRRKHTLHVTVQTTVKPLGGKPLSFKSQVTITLRR